MRAHVTIQHGDGVAELDCDYRYILRPDWQHLVDGDSLVKVAWSQYAQLIMENIENLQGRLPDATSIMRIIVKFVENNGACQGFDFRIKPSCGTTSGFDKNGVLTRMVITDQQFLDAYLVEDDE